MAFPDYSGNNMFNTPGDRAANPKTGLLFVDFERGDTLKLSGEARISWNTARLGEVRRIAPCGRVSYRGDHREHRPAALAVRGIRALQPGLVSPRAKSPALSGFASSRLRLRDLAATTGVLAGGAYFVLNGSKTLGKYRLLPRSSGK